MKDQTISLCITTRNRPIQTIESFVNVYACDVIDEILILDDDSTLVNFVYLCDYRDRYFKEKVRIESNDECIGMQANKAKAISLAKNDWVYLLDSDNILAPDAIDVVKKLEYWDEDTIYCPSFAKPHFDYRKFQDHYFDSDNIKVHMQDQTMKQMLNTGNYFLNKKYYAKTYKYDPKVKAADTILHAYHHMRIGGGLYVVQGLEYTHSVHDESGWKADLQENRKKFKEIEAMIMDL